MQDKLQCLLRLMSESLDARFPADAFGNVRSSTPIRQSLLAARKALQLAVASPEYPLPMELFKSFMHASHWVVYGDSTTPDDAALLLQIRLLHDLFKHCGAYDEAKMPALFAESTYTLEPRCNWLASIAELTRMRLAVAPEWQSLWRAPAHHTLACHLFEARAFVLRVHRALCAQDGVGFAATPGFYHLVNRSSWTTDAAYGTWRSKRMFVPFKGVVQTVDGIRALLSTV